MKRHVVIGLWLAVALSEYAIAWWFALKPQPEFIPALVVLVISAMTTFGMLEPKWREALIDRC